MRLLAIGVDHQSTPASIREMLAFDRARQEQGLAFFASSLPDHEVAILSTCNRVEIYLASASDSITSPGKAADLLGQFHGIDPSLFANNLINYHDQGVIGHLFRVASSIESLVLGEGQILGQVRDAYQAAVNHKTINSILHPVFQSALHVGKIVRERTGMDQGRLSVASVAVDLAQRIFDSFTDKTILVLGAGKMAELTLERLKSLKPGRILIVNRDAARAREATKRFGGQALPFEQLDHALIAADVVISTTAAPHPIISRERYLRIQKSRQNRLVLILDIAVPRDFDPTIGDLDQVMLYHVDDLQAQVQQNLLERRRAIEPALAIIDREAMACYSRLIHRRDAGILLRELGDYADRMREQELNSLFATHPELTPKQREAISRMMVRLQNQVLHHPRAAVRSAVEESHHDHTSGQPHPVLAFVRHIFGLGDRSTSSLKRL